MSKFKRLLSVILTISLLCTTFLSTGMIAHASMLPLEEVNAYLILSNYTADELADFSMDLLLDLLKDSNGQKIEIADSATKVWKYTKDSTDGIETYDEYTIGGNQTVNLYPGDGVDSFTLQLIIGNYGQLYSKNVRYVIDCLLTDNVTYSINDLSFELFTEPVNNTGEGRKPLNPVSVETIDKGDEWTFNNMLAEPISISTYNVYVCMKSELTNDPRITVKVRDSNNNYITDEIMPQDSLKEGSGHIFKPLLADQEWYVIEYYFNGEIQYSGFITFGFAAGVLGFSNELYTINDGIRQNVLAKEKDAVIDGSLTIENELLIGYDPSAEYYCTLDVNLGTDIVYDDKVVKIVEGFHSSLESVENLPDIKDELLNSGYKADYSGDGVNFTIYFVDGWLSRLEYYYLNVRTVESTQGWREFTDKPIIGEADPWLRVTGASSTAGREYDTYVIENGKNINMDTYYGYGYQTIFINDASTDLSSIKPEFWYANTERVYAVDINTGEKIDTDHIRDFSNENQQYTGIIIDNNKQNERNYWVTFKKLNNNGSELFVYGPSAREVILDEYFEFKHDILIANIGNAPLEDISVQLLDAENVKIDSYWTVGGDGNDTLAAFTTTKTNSKYGTLANLAKIRLLPDGDGEVKGTLVITAKGQDPVMITLNGTAQNPEIVTGTLDDAVKYVPYQHIIATNNMHDWVETQFSIVEGQLPNGITLNAETGEIYGVPTVPEGSTATTYTFTVKATFLVDGVEGYFDSATKQFSITVKPNTDENVYLASDGDEGYYILDHIGTEDGQYHYVIDVFEDTVFRSNGTYGEFKRLWLNGELLVEGVDYESEEGSTKITVKGQTFENKTNTDETNTIAMEFRNEDNELNRTSQNFVPKTYPNVDKLIAKINALPAANNITLSNKNAVQSARSDYNALSSTEKNKVTNYSKLVACEDKIAQLEADQSAANAVIAKINAIPSTINSNARDEISAARTAYNALTSAQKSLVTNLKKLTDAEAALQQYDAQQADKAAAENVEALIRAIPSTIDANAKDEIQAARAAYNALTSAQKGYVSNYSRLTDAENALKIYEEQQAQIAADKAAANTVIAKINAIPSTINSNARDEISAARTAYNALTSAQKSLVTNLKRLTDAEAALQQYDAQQADKAAAENVEALIRAIPSTIDANAKDEIQAARAAYNALTSAQKGYVSNYSRLTDAENALKTYEEQQAQIAADKAAANTAIAKINAIPTNLTLDDKDAVNAARTAYNALTSAQKGYVTNYSKLTSAEERITDLEEEAAEQAVVNAVIAAINDIPDNLTLNDKAKISAARNAYNGLTNAQKAKVINYSDLTDAEATIAALEAQENANKADKEAADAVIAKINALPDEITLNDKNVVDAARTAYDALTQKQKDLVTNYSTLTNAEASIKALEEYETANKRDQEVAKAVIDLIDALPETITLEDKNNVAAARTAYDSLTDKQKEIVTNYSELTAAEVKIAELEDDNYEEVQKVTFVGIMVDKDGNAYVDKLIEIHSVVQNGRTDENGSFQFNNVEFGDHTIYIKSEDGSVIAQKSFNIKIGSPLSITDDEIVAENGAIFTVRMQVDGNNIKFLSVEEGNKAPVVDTDKDDEGGIDIGDDETPDYDDDDDDGINIGDADKDDDDDGINIGDADKDDGNKDDGSKPTPDQDVQSPQTGDNSNITLWVILLIISLFGLYITSKKNFFEKKAR